MIAIWLRGLLLRRRGTTLAAAIGTAVAVALLASIGCFLASSTAKMTQQAVAGVPIDWQVEVAVGADPAAVLGATKATPGVRTALPVGYASTSGFESSTGGTVQTTGPGVVLGLPGDYRAAFPAEIRDLAGASTGVLLFQQTAANLHASPGDVVSIGRAGLPPARVRVDGIVDLPAADELFQAVGAAANAQPSAPPDNVLLLPADQWHQLFDGLAASAPTLVRSQVHAGLDHALPSDPAVAYTSASGLGRNLETRLAGSGVVGDNLGRALDRARSDAVYARLLFVLLGLPGAALAGALAVTVATSAAERRRREGAVLRARGADSRRVLQLAMGEATAAAVVGAAAGLAVAAGVGTLAFGSFRFAGTTAAAAVWAAGAVLLGAAVAYAAIAYPAWRDARSTSIAVSRRSLSRRGRPRWQRWGLDLWLVAAAAVVWYRVSRTGYGLVLAPEGVPTISIDYSALLAPLLAWIGGALLIWRLAELALRSARVLRPVVRIGAGRLAPLVAAVLMRRRRRTALATTLVALATCFAVTVSSFDATYRQQSEVDARLTNGADVVVQEAPGAAVGPDAAGALAAVPGVASVEPLQHRFAYVGNDLQDLYGVRATSIVDAASLQDAYVAGGTARGLFARLAAEPDAVLVSAETVHDFQLHPGDRLTLRLQDQRSRDLVPVPFTYVGVAKEFPTAPRDSFLVANADYVAQQTGSGAIGSFLIQTDGTGPASVADRVRAEVGTSATVTDIESARRVVGSSLTAVELAGLTRIELAFASAILVASSGLVLALGFAERRRSFAIATALGARSRQLGAFVWTETAFVVVVGTILGLAGGAVLATMLVDVLTQVFDPPPAHVAIPWTYLAVTLGAGVATAVAVALVASRRLVRTDTRTLREL